MFDIEDTSWIARSTNIEQSSAQISFLIKSEFYKDPNDLSNGPTVLLPAPKLNSLDTFAPRDLEVFGNESALACHYKSVLALADKYGLSFEQISHHFWLNLKISWDGGALGFPIYDTLEEMQGIFYFLETSQENEYWHDLDQGWEVLAVRWQDRFYFREGGFDQGGERTNVSFPVYALLSSITDVRNRTESIVQKLSEQIGVDHWSRPHTDSRLEEESLLKRLWPFS